jgi:hypothetical protein
MHRRILAWPGVGPVIGDFLHHGVISHRSKMTALAGMLAAFVLILFIGIGAVLASMALFGIAFAALYVVSRPTSTATPHLTTAGSHGTMGETHAGGLSDGGSIGHRTAGCGSTRFCGTMSYLPGGCLDAQPLPHVGVSAPAEYAPAQFRALAQDRNQLPDLGYQARHHPRLFTGDHRR